MEKSVIGIYKVDIDGNDFGYIRFPIVNQGSIGNAAWLLEAIEDYFGYMPYGRMKCELSPMLDGECFHFVLIDSYEEYTE
jgi:hypothetical protein